MVNVPQVLQDPLANKGTRLAKKQRNRSLVGTMTDRVYVSARSLNNPDGLESHPARSVQTNASATFFMGRNHRYSQVRKEVGTVLHSGQPTPFFQVHQPAGSLPAINAISKAHLLSEDSDMPFF